MSISPGRRAESAQFSHAQAIVRRGEPVQFQWWGEFEPQSRPARPLLRVGGRFQDCGMVKKCP
jgi:hypothetical protein